MVHFNSHAHVERDEYHPNNYIILQISTHTLTWSVTKQRIYKKKYWIISTHTLTWSVTQTAKDAIAKYNISTHTLTWSVTSHSFCALCVPVHFNSHAHVERDKIEIHQYLCKKHFNSHAHVERDYSFQGRGIYHVYFNSHAHVERDLLLNINRASLLIFQLTRSRGA